MNFRYNVSMRYLAVLIFLILSEIAYASPAEEPPDNSIPILDTAQELLGARANFAANQIDTFFATDRADDEFGRSRIRIRSRFFLRERAVSDLSNQYRINLKLPRLEQKFQYEFDKKDKEEKPGEKKKDKEQERREQIAEFSEAEIYKKDKWHEGWIFNSDIGVSAAIPPKLTTRARVRKNFVTGSLIHRFVEQLTYVTDESGLEEETRLESDHIYNEDLIFRFTNLKRWQVLKKDFFTTHGPSWIHRVTDNDAFVYSASFQTVIDNSRWFLSNHQLAVNYRRNVYRQWFYFDVITGLDFPKQYSFRRNPFITFQIELLFGS